MAAITARYSFWASRLVLIGALAVGGFEAISNAQSGAWRGHLLFLTASCCWAAYTVRFNWASLDPVDGAILLLGWSAIAFSVGLLVFGTTLTTLPTPILALQLFQGFMAGFVANFTYLYAVRALGSAIAAAAAAMVPTYWLRRSWLDVLKRADYGGEMDRHHNCRGWCDTRVWCFVSRRSCYNK